MGNAECNPTNTARPLISYQTPRGPRAPISLTRPRRLLQAAVPEQCEKPNKVATGIVSGEYLGLAAAMDGRLARRTCCGRRPHLAKYAAQLLGSFNGGTAELLQLRNGV